MTDDADANNANNANMPPRGYFRRAMSRYKIRREAASPLTQEQLRWAALDHHAHRLLQEGMDRAGERQEAYDVRRN